MCFLENDNSEIHVELLNNAAFISYEICSILNKLPQKESKLTAFFESINKIISAGKIFEIPSFINCLYIFQ